MTLPAKPLRVALIFGGVSPEHEVSIVSARNVHRLLEAAGYQVFPVGIALDGQWHCGASAYDTLCQATAVAAEKIPSYEDFARHLGPLHADAVFPIVHGLTGEDGCLQGYCQLLGIPFVGGGILNMALTWDKLATKWSLSAHGIPQIPFFPLYRNQEDLQTVLDRAVAEWGFPIFVKPSRTGSSIGISKATDCPELKAGVTTAFEYDHRIVLEKGVSAMEVEVAALGGELPLVSVAGEIIPENDFYDFEEKYLKNSTRFKLPAELSLCQQAELEQIVRRAWPVLDCYGMARFDFLITPDTVYLNEVNPLPGFTTISMYPKLLAHSGISGPQLMKTLVDSALLRQKNRLRKNRFQSQSDWFKDEKE